MWQIGTISLVCLQRCFQEVVCLLFGHFVSFWSCPCLLLGCFVSSRCLCLSLWDCFVSVQRHFVSPEDVVSLRLLCVSWRLFPVLVVSFCSFFWRRFCISAVSAFLSGVVLSQCVSLWLLFVSGVLCFLLCLWCAFLSPVDVVFCFQCVFVPLLGYLVSFLLSYLYFVCCFNYLMSL